MRYPVSEKLEIIRLVERSHLPVRRTLDKLGIPATTFYRWYDRYRAFGQAGLEDRTSGPGRVWNRIPDDVRRQIVDLALDEPELSPRELAVTFTDTKGYFVSEASVYRLLKAHDLITSPAFVVIKAADAFQDPTTAPNQLWQTDFTYLKVVGWGYLSTILDDYSRYIIAWKLCTTIVEVQMQSLPEVAGHRPGLFLSRAAGHSALTSGRSRRRIAGGADTTVWQARVADTGSAVQRFWSRWPVLALPALSAEDRQDALKAPATVVALPGRRNRHAWSAPGRSSASAAAPSSAPMAAGSNQPERRFANARRCRL